MAGNCCTNSAAAELEKRRNAAQRVMYRMKDRVVGAAGIQSVAAVAEAAAVGDVEEDDSEDRSVRQMDRTWKSG